LIADGALLSCSVYSRLPTFCVPIGTMRFCAASAAATSCADSPRACIAATSRSICTWRCLPPYGKGIAAPCTVTSGGRTVLTPRSNSACSDSPLPDSASCRIGTVDAL
jgi:hypothetical protein